MSYAQNGKRLIEHEGTALGADEGKRYVNSTKTLPIEPLTVKEVRKALEARQACRCAKAKPYGPRLCHWNTPMEGEWVARAGGRTLRREHYLHGTGTN